MKNSKQQPGAKPETMPIEDLKVRRERYTQWLESWRNDPSIGYRKNYANAIGLMIKALPVPLEEVTPEILEETAKKASDSHETREKIRIACRHFIDYAHGKGWIKSKQQLRRNALGTRREKPLPETLRNQLLDILKKHRHKRTGDPLSDDVSDKRLETMEAFFNVVSKANPSRTIAKLEHFSAEDMETHQRVLENEPSPYTGKPIKPRTVKTVLGHVLAVFISAAKQLHWKSNPMDSFELPLYEYVQKEAYIAKANVSALRDPGPLEDMTDRKAFLAVRNATMAAVQYDPALRPEDVVRLLAEDIHWEQADADGLVPFEVRDGKSRAKGTRETLHFTPQGVTDIRRYLDSLKKYCAKYGIKIKPFTVKKTGEALGAPLFITEDGRPMSPETYEGIFKDLARRAGLDPKIASHSLRHSRISHWLEDGIPIDRVSRLARHRDVNFTMKKYAHYLPGSDRSFLAKAYGKKPAAEPILTKALLPERPVLRKIIEALLGLLGLVVDAARIAQLEEALVEKIQGKAGRKDLCYGIPEAMERLRLGRTQIYDWMRRGYLHPIAQLNSRKGLPREEIDRLASLRNSKEAALILGYEEKKPTTIQRLVREGTIKATRLGNENLFTDRDLTEHLLRLNSHKMAFGVRPRRPRMAPMKSAPAPVLNFTTPAISGGPAPLQ